MLTWYQANRTDHRKHLDILSHRGKDPKVPPLQMTSSVHGYMCLYRLQKISLLFLMSFYFHYELLVHFVKGFVHTCGNDHFFTNSANVLVYMG